jgi:hypothetical protein
MALGGARPHRTNGTNGSNTTGSRRIKPDQTCEGLGGGWTVQQAREERNGQGNDGQRNKSQMLLAVPIPMTTIPLTVFAEMSVYDGFQCGRSFGCATYTYCGGSGGLARIRVDQGESNRIKPGDGQIKGSPSPCPLPQERVSAGAASCVAGEAAGTDSQTQSGPVKPGQTSKGGLGSGREKAPGFAEAMPRRAEGT